MHARSITVMGDPDALDEGIAYVRDEVMPAITAMDGCVGLSMLVDRETGQCIVTSSWQTEDAMNASDLHLAPMRRRGAEIIGGTPHVEPGRSPSCTGTTQRRKERAAGSPGSG